MVINFIPDPKINTTDVQCHLPSSGTQDCLAAKLHLRSDHCRVEPSSASGAHCPLGGDIQTLDIAPDPRPHHLPTPLLLLIIQAANTPLSNCKTAFYARTHTFYEDRKTKLSVAPGHRTVQEGLSVVSQKGTPNSVIQPLQKIQNFAARLVLLAPRQHHSTPPGKIALASISERIKYKVACMCFNAINGSVPAYLSV